MNKQTEERILKLCDKIEYKVELTKWIYLRNEMSLFILVTFVAIFNLVGFLFRQIMIILMFDIIIAIVSMACAVMDWLRVERLK
jgi:hypothetical protein